MRKVAVFIIRLPRADNPLYFRPTMRRVKEKGGELRASLRYYPLAPPLPRLIFFLRNNWPFIHFSSCRGGRTTLPVSNASHPLVFFFSNYYYFPMQRGVERRKPRLHIRIFLFWTFGFDDQGRYVPPPTAYPSPSTHFFSSKILKLGSSASNVQLSNDRLHL